MNKFSIASAATLLVLTSSLVVAQEGSNTSGVCTGQVDVSSLEIGCDGEASRTISLAACDFRTGRVPNVTITSVIDGRSSSVASVSVQSVDTSNFTVLITPLPRLDNENVCKVQTIDWTAE